MTARESVPRVADRADEIAREIKPAERARIGAALAILEEHGIDIAAPWEGSLDDLELERFEAIAAALRSYGRSCRDGILETAALMFEDDEEWADAEAAAVIRSLKSSEPEAQDTPA